MQLRHLLSAFGFDGGSTSEVVLLTFAVILLQLNLICMRCRTMLNDETLGSTLVFRQGNPLTQPDLHNVNAYYAASTVILGDQSRY